MLADIENNVVKILQENLIGIPVRVSSEKQIIQDQGIVLSNIKFKFKKGEFSEDQPQHQEPLQDLFSGNSTKKTFVLSEVPLRRSLVAQYPIGNILVEKIDFLIDYEKPALSFFKAPVSGKNNILVKYQSRKSIITLKTIGLKALYSIDVVAKDRSGADELSDKVVKVILTNEERLLRAGIETTAVGGLVQDVKDGLSIVSLRYIFGQDLRTQAVVQAMDQIDISSKNKLDI